MGYASAGVKITLINVNNMKYWTPESPYTDADMDQLNKDQFHVMHHEFSHILHQTKSYPVAFGQITAGTYMPRDWQNRDSIETHMLGYLTHYGSSATYEDFVELLSCTITDTDTRWMNTSIDACANGGLKVGDKEQVLELMHAINEITVNVKNDSDEMMEGSKQVSYEMDRIASMTTSVNTNVKNMTEKTDAIGELSKKAHGYVEKNVESIAKLRDAMNKFKVE